MTMTMGSSPIREPASLFQLIKMGETKPVHHYSTPILAPSQNKTSMIK